jgi:uncharacterized membrane protein YphA (DoxX/SURF4 family)
MTSRTLRILDWVLRIGLGSAFLFAGSLKWLNPASFAESIANYQLFPEYSYILAAIFPAVELVTGLGLILSQKRWRAPSAVLLICLLVVFSSAILWAWSQGINTDCGCFGVGSTDIGPWPILRNSSLITCAALIIWIQKKLGNVTLS